MYYDVSSKRAQLSHGVFAPRVVAPRVVVSGGSCPRIIGMATTPEDNYPHFRNMILSAN